MTTTAELKIEKELWVYDIETLACCYLIGLKKVGVEDWKWFEISNYRNDIDGMVKLLKDTPLIGISFNGLSFDSQVVQYIIDMSEVWYNSTGADIVQMIYNFAQNLIDNQNYEIRKLPYREQYMDMEQWDLFSILGYENKNKRTSLKWIEFSLDMPIQEMPYHHSRKDLTEQECEEVRRYCETDIRTTEQLYYLVRGQSDNEFYREKDEIQYRLDTIKEVGLPHKAVNYSGVRLGEEIVLKGYIEESGVTMNKLWEKKKANKPRTQFKFGDCIPKYVKFKTRPFHEFCKMVKEQDADIWLKDQKFPFTWNGTTYSIMKGGIHSVDPARTFRAENGMMLRDADIGSQYPNSINKRKLAPGHMGAAWNVNYVKQIEKRVGPDGYKNKGKKNKFYKGLAEVWKLVLNGGSFGKMNDKFSVQYDPFPHFSCTIGNQFEILMLIESLEMEGIHVVSANTDGILSYFPAEKDIRYMEICKEWEVAIGNDKLGQLEYTDYKLFAQTSVNDYIAIQTDGKIKTKGDFAKDCEIHKNKSKRIIPLAMEEWFVNGIPVEDTIRNDRNIYNFCIGKKSSADYFYKGINRKTGEVKDLDNRLIRYYCSTKEIGERLWKIKRDTSDKKGPKQSKCEASSEYQVLFNTPFTPDKWEEYAVDTEFYIRETNKLLHKIDPVKKRLDTDKAKCQISLF